MLTSTLLQNKPKNTVLFSCINNLDKPSCNTCKFYKPEKYCLFDSINSKCSLYGNKNLHTGEIEYSYAIECRKNETICGEEGKLYKENKLVNISIISHHFTNYGIIYSALIIYFITVLDRY